MKIRKKWHKEIKSWADGAEIEYLDLNGKWMFCPEPIWDDVCEYRVKPEKTTHKVYINLFRHGFMKYGFSSEEEAIKFGKEKAGYVKTVEVLETIEEIYNNRYEDM